MTLCTKFAPEVDAKSQVVIMCSTMLLTHSLSTYTMETIIDPTILIGEMKNITTELRASRLIFVGRNAHAEMHNALVQVNIFEWPYIRAKTTYSCTLQTRIP